MLNTIAYKEALKAAFLASIPSPTPEQIAALEPLCASIATATATFIMSATINYTTGLVAPPTGGPVTGAFVGSIS